MTIAFVCLLAFPVIVAYSTCIYAHIPLVAHTPHTPRTHTHEQLLLCLLRLWCPCVPMLPVILYRKVLQLYSRTRIGLSLATQLRLRLRLRLDSGLALLAMNPAANESVKLLAVAKSIQIRYTSSALGARCQNTTQSHVLQPAVCLLPVAEYDFFWSARFAFVLSWWMPPVVVVGEVFSKSKSAGKRYVAFGLGPERRIQLLYYLNL